MVLRSVHHRDLVSPDLPSRGLGRGFLDSRGADALYALAPQAVGADPGGLVGSALVDADGLEVGQPPALGLVHRVTDIVSRHGTLAAHVASLGHNRASVPKTTPRDKGALAGTVNRARLPRPH